MTGPRLSIEQVSKAFPGAAHSAVEVASLVAPAGQVIALLGPSGAGKTTLLRLIAGFERLDSGVVRVGDRVVSGPGVHVPPEARGVGFVFQQGALFPHLTARQNIAFGLRHLAGRERGERVAAVGELCAIERLLDRYPHELSGGEQQRVALARALARRVGVVLLDEPMSSVDVRLRAEIGADMRRILRAAGTTAVFVTHDHSDAFALADTVAVMLRGSIHQVGSPEAVYRSPATLDVARFIGVPNLVPARRRGDVVETEIGTFTANGARGTEDGPLVALVQAEDLGLEPDPVGAGEIESSLFQGKSRSYRVRLRSGLTLRCSVPLGRGAPLQPGSRVRIVPASSVVSCFPGAGVAGGA
ncbi:MAG TPA: ABC transporter ATP-binding protein [Gemmatimonadaceae bacterium]|nr:ABC transporter ATP-binding protein [Gemmatimonadaceae bacterium]